MYSSRSIPSSSPFDSDRQTACSAHCRAFMRMADFTVSYRWTYSITAPTVNRPVPLYLSNIDASSSGIPNGIILLSL